MADYLMKIRIGSKINHTLFGGEKCTGVVEDLQICRQGMKEGRSVATADVSKHHGVIDLDNGHWCYFDQVTSVVNY